MTLTMLEQLERIYTRHRAVVAQEPLKSIATGQHDNSVETTLPDTMNVVVATQEPMDVSPGYPAFWDNPFDVDGDEPDHRGIEPEEIINRVSALLGREITPEEWESCPIDLQRALLGNIGFPPDLATETPATNRNADHLTVVELEHLLGVELEPVDREPVHDDAETWDLLFERDRRELLNPVARFPACTWCGGITIHAADCFSLDLQGPFRMPFGKHRDTPVALLPPRYLHWLTENAGADFETAISEKRKCPALSPEMLLEIRRLLHAEKHDYQPGPYSWESKRDRKTIPSATDT